MGASGRDDAERRALVAVAVGVRAAIVRAAAAGRRIDDGGPLTSFAGFPRHCCGETADLLREVLGALGWPGPPRLGGGPGLARRRGARRGGANGARPRRAAAVTDDARGRRSPGRDAGCRRQARASYSVGMSSRSTHGVVRGSSRGLRRWQAGLLAAILLFGGRGASGQVVGDSVRIAARGWAAGPDGDRLWVAPGDVYRVDAVENDTAYVTVGGVRFGIDALLVYGCPRRAAAWRTASGPVIAGVGGYAWGTAPTPILRGGADWAGADRLVVAGALGGVRARIEYLLRDRRLVAGRYVPGVGPGETPAEVHARVAADLERSLGPPTCGPRTAPPCAGSPRGVRPEATWRGDGGTVTHRLHVVDGEVVHEVVYREEPR